MKNTIFSPADSELGKSSAYEAHYNPNRLFPIDRSEKRAEIGLDPENLPFKGVDIWNHYEVSWLNSKGKPKVAVAEIRLPCQTPRLIESKSMKLYFNTFNGTPFESMEMLESVIQKDLSEAAQGPVWVKLRPLNEGVVSAGFEGESLDALDLDFSCYVVESAFLSTSPEIVQETLCSDLLKSNCLVTHQPDWASVQIRYKGPKIHREGLLKYLVSFRNHDEFHEQCIERIFMDIMTLCRPQQLTVYGRYTRRGGLDINPYRTTETFDPDQLNQRLVRQ